MKENVIRIEGAKVGKQVQTKCEMQAKNDNDSEMTKKVNCKKC